MRPRDRVEQRTERRSNSRYIPCGLGWEIHLHEPCLRRNENGPKIGAVDSFYIRWIGVPVAVLTCLGLIVIAFFVHWIAGILAFLFVGSVAEVLLSRTYSKQPTARDTYKAPQ